MHWNAVGSVFDMDTRLPHPVMRRVLLTKHSLHSIDGIHQFTQSPSRCQLSQPRLPPIPSPVHFVNAMSLVLRIAFFFSRLHRSHLTPQRTSQCNRAAYACTGRENKSLPPVDRQCSPPLTPPRQQLSLNRPQSRQFIHQFSCERLALTSLNALRHLDGHVHALSLAIESGLWSASF